MEKINIGELIAKNNFRFKKSLGQNFVTDQNLLAAIVSDAKINQDDIVVEIGAGAGTLTRILSDSAKKVVAFEIDNDLKDLLDITLDGIDNAEVIFSDILKMSDSEIEEVAGGTFKVVANLPYYITTPILQKLFDSSLNIESITVMVQKEVGERICAKPKNKEYGALTLLVQLFGDAKITRIVSRHMFRPTPDVDSAVVRIDIHKDKYSEDTLKKLKKLIRASFSMRRKTLVNNLSANYAISKEDAARIIEKAGITVTARAEELSLSDFEKLAENF